jgi:hypothetical protein
MPHHKFQHLYSVLTLWTTDDQLGYFYRFSANETVYEEKTFIRKQQDDLAYNGSGLFYNKNRLFREFGLPSPWSFIDAPWWTVLIGFIVAMHYTAGIDS